MSTAATKTPNARQQRAIDGFRKYLEKNLYPNADYGDMITKFEVTFTDYGVLWVSAETEYMKLPIGNLLRAVSHEYWHLEIGKRGGISVWSCPKSMEQFRGGYAFGMRFVKIKGVHGKTPDADDLRFAAEWLRQYDDTHDGGAQTAIANMVAEWLDAQASSQELRAVAREHGVPVGKLRARLEKA